MTADKLLVLVGIYDNVADVEAAYALVRDLRTEAGLIDRYEASVIESDAAGV